MSDKCKLAGRPKHFLLLAMLLNCLIIPPATAGSKEWDVERLLLVFFSFVFWWPVKPGNRRMSLLYFWRRKYAPDFFWFVMWCNLGTTACHFCKYIYLLVAFFDLWSGVTRGPGACDTVTLPAPAVTNPCHIWICPFSPLWTFTFFFHVQLVSCLSILHQCGNNFVLS